MSNLNAPLQVSKISWQGRLPLFLYSVVACTILAPSLGLGNYLSGLLVQAFIFGIVALVTDVIWGYLGILTFASSAMFGIGAYALGIMFVHVSPTLGGAILAVLAAILVAGLVSTAIGWLAFYSRAKLSEFYLAVVTLGASILFGQAVLWTGTLTGGSNGLSGFATLSLSNQAWYAVAAAALLISGSIALKILSSDFGLLMRAIRDNEMRCRYLSIKTPGVKTAVFSVCNSLIAAMGAFYALFTTVVAPSLVGLTLATNVLIWVILGGRATIVGPALAAILVTAATPQLSTTMPLYWQGLLGLVFVLGVLFLPRGVLPTILSAVGMGMRFWSRQPAAARFDIGSHLRHAEGTGPVLQIEAVSKNFGSFKALTNVSLSVQRGELLSIVGPNGAGKTSLVRCISDGNERSSGLIRVGGTSIGQNPPDCVAALGVGRKFQTASVFETLTVAECMQIATWKGKIPNLFRRSHNLTLAPAAAEVVNALDLNSVWNVAARDISHGQRQALELAMVLAQEPSVVILDEPTAGLTVQERTMVGEVLSRLVATEQLAVILIEHDFEFVKRISTRVVVLVAGKLLADGTIKEVASSKLVREAYLGRSYKERIA